MAFTQLRLGETDAATKNLEATLAKSPAEFRSSALLATAKILQKDLKGAEAGIAKCLRQRSQISRSSHHAGPVLLV